ncbi:MAG: PEP-CTERM sorting domain-containing protein, partial [Planctomycetales bacterium]|nr:PEP-CTERM sorting domain-containing protein [Planctomycetales bacterium]
TISPSETGWEFEVDPATGNSDKFVLANPDSNVFTTKLNVDGAQFFINSASAPADGTSFQILVADQIIGTPTIFPPEWVFNSATGMITFGGGLSGDFNGDGVLDAADIDALSAQVRAGTNPAAYDLNSDNVVDGLDRDVWVNELKKTYYGDSNLDGQFDSSDFVTVFTAGEYEDAIDGNSTWGTGDWNGDGDFNSSDFVTAFSAGGYEQGPRAAVSAVPEPSSFVLMLLGLSAFARRRRR